MGAIGDLTLTHLATPALSAYLGLFTRLTRDSLSQAMASNETKAPMTEAEKRQQRLEQQLRANLQKRKAQARARRDTGS